jgi:hypothetical protein
MIGFSADSRLAHADYQFVHGQDQSRKPGFTETRFRPLARRRDKTAWPLLVFILVRKPCVLERRRRFG